MKRYIKSAAWSELPEDVKQKAADEYQFKRFASEAKSSLRGMFPNSELNVGRKELKHNKFSDTELEVYGILDLLDMTNFLYKNNILKSKEYNILDFCFNAKEVVGERWNKLLVGGYNTSRLTSYIASIIWDVEDGYDTNHPEFSNKEIENTLDIFEYYTNLQLTTLGENFTHSFIDGAVY